MRCHRRLPQWLFTDSMPTAVPRKSYASPCDSIPFYTLTARPGRTVVYEVQRHHSRPSGRRGRSRRPVSVCVRQCRRDGAPATHDQAVLVESDLAILGASLSRFDEYDRQVRVEYRRVPSFSLPPQARRNLAVVCAATRSTPLGLIVLRSSSRPASVWPARLPNMRK